MKKLLLLVLPALDVFLYFFTYIAGILLKNVRAAGLKRLPFCKKALLQVGVFPIRDHYYEPLFHPRHILRSLSRERILPGIDWNVEGQLELLDRFDTSDELKDVPVHKSNKLAFYMDNGMFESGDAEFWYHLIRLKKPQQIYEIGSGNSTLMVIKALQKNKNETPGYKCKHICIEPYEMPWLEETGVSVIRNKIEEVDKKIFQELGEGDILFIDSSHIIRPQGDILFEYLELLPSLNRGVIVHVHDIFSPRDYPKKIVLEDVLFWNEQYLLEAFLTSNSKWKIIGALNYLRHNHYEKLKKKCIFLTPAKEPGSFYIQKTG